MCKPLCAARSSQSSLARAVRLADASRSADEGNHTKNNFLNAMGKTGLPAFWVLMKSACFHEVTRFLHVKTANGFIKIKGLQGGLAAKILSSRLKITLRALSHIESDSNPPFSLFRRIGGEGRIRTYGPAGRTAAIRLLRLQPLSHLSV